MTHVLRAGWYEPGTRTVRRGLPEAVFVTFVKELGLLMNKYFEKDEDGDLPIQVRVIDRTLAVKLQYDPPRQTHNAANPETVALDNLRIANRNVAIAADELKRAYEDVTDLCLNRLEKAGKL